MTVDTKIEKVKGVWKVFEVTRSYGFNFKILIAEDKVKSVAINKAAQIKGDVR